MVSLGRSELIDAKDQLFQCFYLFSVFFVFDAELLLSSHIQYDLLCYSVVLLAVLLGKDEIRTPHKPIVCSLCCVSTGNQDGRDYLYFLSIPINMN